PETGLLEPDAQRARSDERRRCPARLHRGARRADRGAHRRLGAGHDARDARAARPSFLPDARAGLGVGTIPVAPPRRIGRRRAAHRERARQGHELHRESAATIDRERRGAAAKRTSEECPCACWWWTTRSATPSCE